MRVVELVALPVAQPEPPAADVVPADREDRPVRDGEDRRAERREDVVAVVPAAGDVAAGRAERVAVADGPVDREDVAAARSASASRRGSSRAPAGRSCRSSCLRTGRPGPGRGASAPGARCGLPGSGRLRPPRLVVGAVVDVGAVGRRRRRRRRGRARTRRRSPIAIVVPAGGRRGRRRGGRRAPSRALPRGDDAGLWRRRLEQDAAMPQSRERYQVRARSATGGPSTTRFVTAGVREVADRRRPSCTAARSDRVGGDLAAEQRERRRSPCARRRSPSRLRWPRRSRRPSPAETIEPSEAGTRSRPGRRCERRQAACRRRLPGDGI